MIKFKNGSIINSYSHDDNIVFGSRRKVVFYTGERKLSLSDILNIMFVNKIE